MTGPSVALLEPIVDRNAPMTQAEARALLVDFVGMSAAQLAYVAEPMLECVAIDPADFNARLTLRLIGAALRLQEGGPQ